MREKMSRKCRFGLHVWSRWADFENNNFYQVRRCTRCNKAKMRNKFI